MKRRLATLVMYLGLAVAVYNILYLAFTPSRRLLYDGTSLPVALATLGIPLAAIGWSARRTKVG